MILLKRLAEKVMMGQHGHGKGFRLSRKTKHHKPLINSGFFISPKNHYEQRRHNTNATNRTVKARN